MKVAYNACYGGFGLSHKATIKYGKLKGLDLYAYEQVEYKHNGNGVKYIRVDNPEKNSFMHYSTRDLGMVHEGDIPEECHYYKSFYDESTRTDKDLISVIEEMGDSASGDCSELKIASIPDGAQFEIDEYDGNESVVPPRASW